MKLEYVCALALQMALPSETSREANRVGRRPKVVVMGTLHRMLVQRQEPLRDQSSPYEVTESKHQDDDARELQHTGQVGVEGFN